MRKNLVVPVLAMIFVSLNVYAADIKIVCKDYDGTMRANRRVPISSESTEKLKSGVIEISELNQIFLSTKDDQGRSPDSNSIHITGALDLLFGNYLKDGSQLYIKNLFSIQANPFGPTTARLFLSSKPYIGEVDDSSGLGDVVLCKVAFEP